MKKGSGRMKIGSWSEIEGAGGMSQRTFRAHWEPLDFCYKTKSNRIHTKVAAAAAAAAAKSLQSCPTLCNP